MHLPVLSCNSHRQTSAKADRAGEVSKTGSSCGFQRIDSWAKDEDALKKPTVLKCLLDMRESTAACYLSSSTGATHTVDNQAPITDRSKFYWEDLLFFLHKVDEASLQPPHLLC